MLSFKDFLKEDEMMGRILPALIRRRNQDDETP